MYAENRIKSIFSLLEFAVVVSYVKSNIIKLYATFATLFVILQLAEMISYNIVFTLQMQIVTVTPLSSDKIDLK